MTWVSLCNDCGDGVDIDCCYVLCVKIRGTQVDDFGDSCGNDVGIDSGHNLLVKLYV